MKQFVMKQFEKNRELLLEELYKELNIVIFEQTVVNHQVKELKKRIKYIKEVKLDES